MILTCMYLPFDLQTYLLCYSSESSTLITLAPGHFSTSKPARTQTITIQLSPQELVTAFLLTCHNSPRSSTPCHSINLPTVYLPVVSCSVCDRRPDLQHYSHGSPAFTTFRNPGGAGQHSSGLAPASTIPSICLCQSHGITGCRCG